MGDRALRLQDRRLRPDAGQKIVTGIPDADFARVIREDLKRRGLLYLGTEHGIYISFDDGATWQSLRQNLPTTPVHDIVVDERDLVIGTHGRGFYVIDNIGVLRQATPELTSSALHLFEPINPMRGRDRNVSFDYFLNQEAAEVKIEILDAQGTVLRSFAGTPKAAGGAAPTTTRLAAARRASRPPRGINRFSWDMRYEGVDRVPGHDHVGGAAQRGPAAPTGRYTVRITADGETKTRDFHITRDPRLVAAGITDADLAEQFTLSRCRCATR